MIRTTLIATALAAAALGAQAQSTTYMLDPTHTFVTFEISHFGASTNRGRFDKKQGTVEFDRAAKTGKVDITIDTTSVNTGYPLFNQHIQGEDFLATAQFPTATYKSTKVNFDGDKPATIEGNLTLKGITKPVTLTVVSFHCMPHPMLKKDACGATATAKVKRTDFNMGKNAPYVGDEVTITLPVEAYKQ